jgi:hypothetical protein
MGTDFDGGGELPDAGWVRGGDGGGRKKKEKDKKPDADGDEKEKTALVPRRPEEGGATKRKEG